MRDLDQIPESELILLLKQGDTAARNQVYHIYWKELYLFALRLLKDSDDAQDATQDVFLSFFSRAEDLEIKNLRAYLYRSIRNHILNKIGRSKRWDDYVISASKFPDPAANVIDDQINYKELERLILRELEELPADARQIFIMNRFDDKSYKEIQEELQLSPDIVKKRMSFTLKTLKIKLQNFLTFIF